MGQRHHPGCLDRRSPRGTNAGKHRLQWHSSRHYRRSRCRKGPEQLASMCSVPLLPMWAAGVWHASAMETFVWRGQQRTHAKLR